MAVIRGEVWPLLGCGFFSLAGAASLGGSITAGRAGDRRRGEVGADLGVLEPFDRGLKPPERKPSSSSLTFRMEADKLRLGRSVGFGILRVAVGIVAQTHRQPERAAPSYFPDRGMSTSVRPLGTTNPLAGVWRLSSSGCALWEGHGRNGRASMYRCESGFGLTGDRPIGCRCCHAARIEECVGIGTTMRSQDPVTNSRRGQALGQPRLPSLRIAVAALPAL
jgi:hypothetical protein